MKMSTASVLPTYINKLSHPITEIRERALLLLIAKLQLGWDFDELNSTRQLMEALLAWFEVQQPTLQREALDLLLTTLKTKSGTYIAKEYGIRKLLSALNNIKTKLNNELIEIYNDILETLQFLNTVESEEDITVPGIKIPSVSSSVSDGISSGEFYKSMSNNQSSKETLMSSESQEFDMSNKTKTNDSIKVLLFPWVELCSSDSKTILLVEDALKLVKSTRRCCRFIRDVFLRDFPPEIFLNRPIIVQSLLTMANGNHNGRPEDALCVLLCITRALNSRLSQLTSIDLVHDIRDEHNNNEVPDNIHVLDKDINVELEQLVEDISPRSRFENDHLVALKQIPAPIYALDTLHAVLSVMVKSVILSDPQNKNDLLNMKELNLCINLIESLIQLLIECVCESFWTVEHSSKTYRDIAHKSCTVMRLLGDVLTKFNKWFTEDCARVEARVSWLRLVPCAARLAAWCRRSPLPPATLAVALRLTQLDPAVHIFYPDLCQNITHILQEMKAHVDQEYKSKYRELIKLTNCMDFAVKFMKNRNNCRNSKDVLTLIQNSLPLIELHQNEKCVEDMIEIVLYKAKAIDFDDNDWSTVRNIALKLMAHNMDWVCAKFYKMMAEMVKRVLVSDEINRSENEKCLTLIFDVGILTEICCHGLSSEIAEVSAGASELMIYLLRGRMILSEGCWWKLLASLLPVLPLLHVYAEHDTSLGEAVCKSVELDIAECMGVSLGDVAAGLSRLLFVRCVTVQLHAAHTLCAMLDDDRYLPPKESLRADILLNALKRVEPQEFNIDFSNSSSVAQTTGLLQTVEVLKQDIMLDAHGASLRGRTVTLDAALRRDALRQLALLMRHQHLHAPFLQADGIQLVHALLRMSLMVDDYLAYPECAISCVSVLNSICFANRHTLAKITDLPSLLIRVILVFPCDENAVRMASQVLCVCAWAGFALQELDSQRRRVASLPACVTRRTRLPIHVNAYWTTSPNAQHSSLEWLVSDEDWRRAVRVRWWWAWCERGSGSRLAPPDSLELPAPLALRPSQRDVATLHLSCVTHACSSALLAIQNATSHKQVAEALYTLESYTCLIPLSPCSARELCSLPWQHLRRYLCSPPASPRDATLLISLLQFVQVYLDNMPADENSMQWIKSCLLDNDTMLISLLGRSEFYPHQTTQESIEVTQLHINIVKVLLRLIIISEHRDTYDTAKMESLLKILISCLERIDLKNFHMLGLLNEVMRCIRYLVNCRHCHLSEASAEACIRAMTSALCGCAAGGGRKGQACRLDALLTTLAALRHIHDASALMQKWGDSWAGEIVEAVSACAIEDEAKVRAAALQVCAALARHVQLWPHLQQATPQGSLSQYAATVFAKSHEANIVRTAAATLLTAISARHSPHSNVLESEILEQLSANNFVENCLEILVNFCNAKGYRSDIEPNVPISVLERRTELEVRAQKCGDIRVLPSLDLHKGPVPPTPALVEAVADLIHNISTFPNCPVQEWNDQGLYRLLFKCATRVATRRVRTAACRALSSACARKCVRTTLAATEDCLHNLIETLTPLEDDYDVNDMWSRAQALSLLSCLMPERSAADVTWAELKDGKASPFLHLLLQCLDCDEIELQDAGIYCLTQLAQSVLCSDRREKVKDTWCMDLFDNVKSPFESSDLKRGGGDDCQTEYMAEELCKALINLYQRICLKNKNYQSNPGDEWSRVCCCVSSVLAVSSRARSYAVHRRLPRVVLTSLQAVRDHLSVVGKPADVIRNAEHNPVLRTLCWILTVITSCMVDCTAAKEAFAEDNVAASLNRLWPWCMMTEPLRDVAVRLLLTFTNDCPKAWMCMSACVCGRTLSGEVCAFATREAARVSRVRSDARLADALRTLRHCVSHHHCRAIILKSDVLSCMYKLRVSEQHGCSGSTSQWARLCEALARHADGASAILALKPLLAWRPLRARLTPALAHAAHHHRTAFIQSPELMEVLAATLLAGDSTEIVSAARAVWALAANNHKAKLVLRSNGVTAAVQTALERWQRRGPDGVLQLLTYTHNVLQST